MKKRLANNSNTTPAPVKFELPQLLRLINEELAAGLRSQGDQVPVHEKNEEREEIGRHICIELAGKQLAVPLSAVMEAGELQQVRSLPLLPDWLSGITNIRGEITSVVNLARFLNWKNRPSGNKRPSFLVVHDDTVIVAITVDRIIGTRSLYRSPVEQSGQRERTSLPTALYCGKALYEKENGADEIDLFDLSTFLSSQKLREFATA